MSDEREKYKSKMVKLMNDMKNDMMTYQFDSGWILPPSRHQNVLLEAGQIRSMLQSHREVIHMSKFAPVAPVHIYTAMREAGYVPQNVLLLAHDVASQANSKAYEEEFNKTEWDHTNIIMDNSVVETGGAVDLNMVKDAAEIVAADVVVLPDVLGNATASLKATLEAWNNWYWEFRDYQKMVVIQGETMQDWLRSAETLARETLPDWISVPRIAEGISDSKHIFDRWELVDFASAIFGDHIPIHLLGFSDYIWSDLRAASHPRVVSIDSAVPLRLATQCQSNILSEDPGLRGDWWLDVVYDPLMIENCRKVDQLITNLV